MMKYKRLGWNTWLFEYERNSVTIRVSRVRNDGDAIPAEIEVLSEAHNRPLAIQRVDLLSGGWQAKLAQRLNGQHPEVWKPIIEEVISTVVMEWRRPPELKTLTDPIDDRDDEDRTLVEGFLPDRRMTLVYGPGGSGKSLLAHTIALVVASGKPMLFLRPTRKVGVAFLDWEDEWPHVRTRLFRLCRGLEIEPPSQLYYFRMHEPFADSIDRLQSKLADLGVEFVVVDSYIPAAGQEPYGEEAARRFHEAVRILGVTTLVVSHVTKAEVNSNQKSMPIGSVVLWNLARAAWEVRRREEDDDDLEIALYRRKWNSTAKPASTFALRAHFSEEVIAWKPGEIDGTLLRGASIGTKILTFLREGAKTVQEISEELGERQNNVRAALSRLRRTGKIIQIEGEDGIKRWGLSL